LPGDGPRRAGLRQDLIWRLEAAAFAELKHTVKEDVAEKLAACGAAPSTSVFLVDAFGIRDDSFKLDELVFIQALVTATAGHLRKTPAEVWTAFEAAAAAAAAAAAPLPSESMPVAACTTVPPRADAAAAEPEHRMVVDEDMPAATGAKGEVVPVGVLCSCFIRM
jgi:hypothetical protein